MTMIPESEKYNKVLRILRESKPVLNSTADIEKEVINRISRVHKPGFILAEIFDRLFGWAYIGWVRRSLITASLALVVIFVFQQSVILKRIEVLSRQTVVIDKENVSTPADEIVKLLTLYKNTSRKFPSKTITISESQMKELLESLKELQNKYKDLENLIEGDPELKKLIENKQAENNRIKINL